LEILGAPSDKFVSKHWQQLVYRSKHLVIKGTTPYQLNFRGPTIFQDNSNYSQESPLPTNQIELESLTLSYSTFPLDSRYTYPKLKLVNSTQSRVIVYNNEALRHVKGLITDSKEQLKEFIEVSALDEVEVKATGITVADLLGFRGSKLKLMYYYLCISEVLQASYLHQVNTTEISCYSLCNCYHDLFVNSQAWSEKQLNYRKGELLSFSTYDCARVFDPE
jgi:hypothetical protein